KDCFFFPAHPGYGPGNGSGNGSSAPSQAKKAFRGSKVPTPHPSQHLPGPGGYSNHMGPGNYSAQYMSEGHLQQKWEDQAQIAQYDQEMVGRLEAAGTPAPGSSQYVDQNILSHSQTQCHQPSTPAYTSPQHPPHPTNPAPPPLMYPQSHMHYPQHSPSPLPYIEKCNTVPHCYKGYSIPPSSPYSRQMSSHSKLNQGGYRSGQNNYSYQPPPSRGFEQQSSLQAMANPQETHTKYPHYNQAQQNYCLSDLSVRSPEQYYQTCSPSSSHSPARSVGRSPSYSSTPSPLMTNPESFQYGQPPMTPGAASSSSTSSAGMQDQVGNNSMLMPLRSHASPNVQHAASHSFTTTPQVPSMKERFSEKLLSNPSLWSLNALTSQVENISNNVQQLLLSEALVASKKGNKRNTGGSNCSAGGASSKKGEEYKSPPYPDGGASMVGGTMQDPYSTPQHQSLTMELHEGGYSSSSDEQLDRGYYYCGQSRSPAQVPSNIQLNLDTASSCSMTSPDDMSTRSGDSGLHTFTPDISRCQSGLGGDDINTPLKSLSDERSPTSITISSPMKQERDSPSDLHHINMSVKENFEESAWRDKPSDKEEATLKNPDGDTIQSSENLEKWSDEKKYSALYSKINKSVTEKSYCYKEPAYQEVMNQEMQPDALKSDSPTTSDSSVKTLPFISRDDSPPHQYATERGDQSENTFPTQADSEESNSGQRVKKCEEDEDVLVGGEDTGEEEEDEIQKQTHHSLSPPLSTDGREELLEEEKVSLSTTEKYTNNRDGTEQSLPDLNNKIERQSPERDSDTDSAGVLVHSNAAVADTPPSPKKGDEDMEPGISCASAVTPMAKPEPLAPSAHALDLPAKVEQHMKRKPGPKPGSKSVLKLGPKSGQKPGPKSGVKPGSKASPKPGPKAGAKPGPKTAAKPAVQVEPEILLKIETPAKRKPGPKSGSKPGAKSGSKSGSKLAKPALKPGPKPGTKPGPKAADGLPLADTAPVKTSVGRPKGSVSKIKLVQPEETIQSMPGLQGRGRKSPKVPQESQDVAPVIQEEKKANHDVKLLEESKNMVLRSRKPSQEKIAKEKEKIKEGDILPPMLADIKTIKATDVLADSPAQLSLVNNTEHLFPEQSGEKTSAQLKRKPSLKVSATPVKKKRGPKPKTKSAKTPHEQVGQLIPGSKRKRGPPKKTSVVSSPPKDSFPSISEIDITSDVPVASHCPTKTKVLPPRKGRGQKYEAMVQKITSPGSKKHLSISQMDSHLGVEVSTEKILSTAEAAVEVGAQEKWTNQASDLVNSAGTKSNKMKRKRWDLVESTDASVAVLDAESLIVTTPRLAKQRAIKNNHEMHLKQRRKKRKDQPAPEDTDTVKEMDTKIKEQKQEEKSKRGRKPSANVTKKKSKASPEQMPVKPVKVHKKPGPKPGMKDAMEVIEAVVRAAGDEKGELERREEEDKEKACIVGPVVTVSEKQPETISMKRIRCKLAHQNSTLSFCPYVRINNSRDFSSWCAIVNKPDDAVIFQRRRKKGILRMRNPFTVAKGVPHSVAMVQGPSVEKNQTDSCLTCSLCGKPANYRDLGDLCGPYYAEENIPRKLLTIKHPEHLRNESQKTDDGHSGNDEVPGCSSSEGAEGGAEKDGPETSTQEGPRRLTLQERLRRMRQLQAGGTRSPSDPEGKDSMLQRLRVQAEANEHWTHENCAIWTKGIIMVAGRLYGLKEAANKSAQTSCYKCQIVGASLSCCWRGCSHKYHYVCAKEIGCTFHEDDFSIKCPKHEVIK
uniref:Retinoic acid induced 1 n=1 Tax=Tetraodon nigroviridis TaxID=99883 RepID=H3D328_TETNG